VSSRFLPQGTMDEKANGPDVIGQYVPSDMFTGGSGLCGRMLSHRYELFDHALSVRTEEVVKRVAGVALKRSLQGCNGGLTQARAHTS